jgi:hypothetical protein
VSPSVGTLIALVVCVGGAVAAVLLIRKRWRFTDTPTSDAAHVFPGLGEVHGVVEAIGTPARAASDQQPCVWWHYEVERQVKRNRSTDWVTEEEGVTAVPFHVRDVSGVVRVVVNDSVNRLADRLTQFPDSLIAKAARVQPLPLLDKEALR